MMARLHEQVEPIYWGAAWGLQESLEEPKKSPNVKRKEEYLGTTGA